MTASGLADGVGNWLLALVLPHPTVPLPGALRCPCQIIALSTQLIYSPHPPPAIDLLAASYSRWAPS
jgi:hypothetical protein